MSFMMTAFYLVSEATKKLRIFRCSPPPMEDLLIVALSHHLMLQRLCTIPISLRLDPTYSPGPDRCFLKTWQTPKYEQLTDRHRSQDYRWQRNPRQMRVQRRTRAHRKGK